MGNVPSGIKPAVFLAAYGCAFDAQRAGQRPGEGADTCDVGRLGSEATFPAATAAHKIVGGRMAAQFSVEYGQWQSRSLRYHPCKVRQGRGVYPVERRAQAQGGKLKLACSRQVGRPAASGAAVATRRHAAFSALLAIHPAPRNLFVPTIAAVRPMGPC